MWPDVPEGLPGKCLDRGGLVLKTSRPAIGLEGGICPHMLSSPTCDEADSGGTATPHAPCAASEHAGSPHIGLVSMGLAGWIAERETVAYRAAR